MEPRGATFQVAPLSLTLSPTGRDQVRHDGSIRGLDATKSARMAESGKHAESGEDEDAPAGAAAYT